jgi:hypothetical protein
VSATKSALPLRCLGTFLLALPDFCLFERGFFNALPLRYLSALFALPLAASASLFERRIFNALPLRCLSADSLMRYRFAV